VKRLLVSLGRIFLTLAMICAAVVMGWFLWDYYMEEPWTRDGRVRADVVQVTPDVSGLVTQVLVHDNEPVHRGQLLFVLDRPRYQLALAQAEAAVEDQKALLAQAVREDQRNRALGDLVATEVVEQGASRAAELKSALAQAVANRDVARLNLQRTAVTASVDGAVANIDLRPGDYVAVGHPAMALIDIGSLHVDGYFEETKLERVHPGQKAEVKLMGVEQSMSGRVESTAVGIADRERSPSGDLLPDVNPTFTWVRLAQRVPVRIVLDRVPSNIALIVGRTATVTLVKDPPAVGRRS
jgi:multidrug resistance efflux pump